MKPSFGGGLDSRITKTQSFSRYRTDTTSPRCTNSSSSTHGEKSCNTVIRESAEIPVTRHNVDYYIIQTTYSGIQNIFHILSTYNTEICLSTYQRKRPTQFNVQSVDHTSRNYVL